MVTFEHFCNYLFFSFINTLSWVLQSDSDNEGVSLCAGGSAEPREPEEVCCAGPKGDEFPASLAASSTGADSPSHREGSQSLLPTGGFSIP